MKKLKKGLYTSLGLCSSFNIEGQEPSRRHLKPKSETNMTSSIITSDRYIILPSFKGEYVFNGMVRVLTKTEDKSSTVVVPCKWNEKAQRLESVAIASPIVAPFMYEASAKLTAKLNADSSFKGWKFITAEEARELTK